MAIVLFLLITVGGTVDFIRSVNMEADTSESVEIKPPSKEKSKITKKSTDKNQTSGSKKPKGSDDV
jgi:hypothetical protein